jgi:hypothetical protein
MKNEEQGIENWESGLFHARKRTSLLTVLPCLVMVPAISYPDSISVWPRVGRYALGKARATVTPVEIRGTGEFDAKGGPG